MVESHFLGLYRELKVDFDDWEEVASRILKGLSEE